MNTKDNKKTKERGQTKTIKYGKNQPTHIKTSLEKNKQEFKITAN